MNQAMKKFFPLCLILFCFFFNYSILRDTKDTLIVNAGGAALIPFLKSGVSLLILIAFVAMYTKLANIISREKLFYFISIPLVAYFGLFGFFIHPNIDFFHPTKEAVNALHNAYPAHVNLINMYAYWSYSLFYIFAEIWGTIICGFILWEFANYIFSFNEAKRFYSMLLIFSNIALIMAGSVVYFCSESVKKYVPIKLNSWCISIYLLMAIVVVLGCISIHAHRKIYKSILTTDHYSKSKEDHCTEEMLNKKTSIITCKSIMRSPELALIAFLIIAYGVAMNLIEVQWKEQLKLFYAGDKGGYNGFLGMFSMATGSFGLFVMIIGIYILRNYSWLVAAVIAPSVVLVSGALFFSVILSKDLTQPLLDIFNLKFNAIAVFLGAGAIIFSKAIFSALFIPTKEMAYIPLDLELKSKGKAVVDLLVGRFSKTSASWISMLLLTISSAKDVVAIAPYAFATFAVVCVAWLYAVKALSGKVAAAVKMREDERAAA